MTERIAFDLPRAVAERIREVLFGCAKPADWAAFNDQMPARMPRFNRYRLTPDTPGVDPAGPYANQLLKRSERKATPCSDTFRAHSQPSA